MRPAPLLLALLLPALPAAAAEGDPPIAFCRPMPGLCACSAETVEDLLAPEEFARHLRRLRAGGALTGPELAAALVAAERACAAPPASPVLPVRR